MNRLVLAALIALAASPCAIASPDANQAKARAIYETLIGYETSVGKGQVPAMAAYLVDQFRRGGFSDADIHLLPLGETESLVVR